VQWEDALDAFVGDDAADGDRAIDATTLGGKQDALENLHAFLVTFDDSIMHVNRVTDAKGWDFCGRLQVLGLHALHDGGSIHV